MEEGKSFWTTLPGILTGIAAVITAIGGILIFFYGGSPIDSEPTVELFEASPDTIVAGENVTLNWETSDATHVTITPGVGSVDLSGSVTVSPNETTTYILKAMKDDKSDTATEVVTVEGGAGPETRNVGPKIESFEVSPDKIDSGKGTTLSWSVSDATHVTIDQGIGSVDLNGSKTVHPAETTTYTITATNEAGTSKSTAVIYVNEGGSPKIEYFNVYPEIIVSGDSATLSWDVSGATDVTITPKIGDVPPSGSVKVYPTETTTYTITAKNEDGSDRETETVHIEDVFESPVIEYFNANPGEIAVGESTTLSWSVSEATDVTITPDIGSVSLKGSRTVSPTETTTYILTTKNGDESVERSIVVVVDTNVLSTPEQLSPAAGSVLSNYPRTTTLKWSPVAGAVSYTVEIDCYHCCAVNQWCTDIGETFSIVPGITGTSYTFDFVGAQPGRWRVWSVGSTGKESEKSGWWEFTYTV